MKIKFLGCKEQGRKACIPCGRKSSGGYTFKRMKKMVLPSGTAITFHVGYEYEVNQKDGEFLLEQTYLLNGQKTRMFEVA